MDSKNDDVVAIKVGKIDIEAVSMNKLSDSGLSLATGNFDWTDGDEDCENDDNDSEEESYNLVDLVVSVHDAMLSFDTIEEEGEGDDEGAWIAEEERLAEEARLHILEEGTTCIRGKNCR